MKAKHLTISQWSKKVFAVAEKYGLRGTEYVHASIDVGEMSHWGEQKIWYSISSNAGRICISFFQTSWEDALSEFESQAKQHAEKQKYTCPTCGDPIKSLAHKH